MKNNYVDSLVAVNGSSHLFRVIKPIRAFKKVYRRVLSNDYYMSERACVAELEIPVGELIVITRSDAHETLQERIQYRKLRASKAKVMSIRSIDGREQFKGAFSGWDSSFKYRVGRSVKPANQFNTQNKTCSGGIHFYRTFTQAREH